MTLQTFVTQLCEHCGVDSEHVEVQVDEQEDQVTIQLNLPPEESGLFIGYRGETLASIQRLIRIAFHQELENKKCALNINEYREQRLEKLQELTETIARRVVETGEPHTFNRYYPSYERFVIHSTLNENPEFESLESVSEGEGADRRLTIRLKD